MFCWYTWNFDNEDTLRTQKTLNGKVIISFLEISKHSDNKLPTKNEKATSINETKMKLYNREQDVRYERVCQWYYLMNCPREIFLTRIKYSMDNYNDICQKYPWDVLPVCMTVWQCSYSNNISKPESVRVQEPIQKVKLI